MAGKNTAVFGIYPTYPAVDAAVEALRVAGFRNTDISVMFPENVGTKDFAHEKDTKAPEGATTGAGTGAVVGGAVGWLAGIGALAIPGARPVHRGGPDHGGAGGRRCRRRRWRPDGRARRHGHSGVRSEALRGARQERRHPPVGALGQFRVDQDGQEHSGSEPALKTFRPRAKPRAT